MLLHFRRTSVYPFLVCQGLTSSDDGKQGSVVRVNPSKEMQNVHAPAALSGLAPKSDSKPLVAFGSLSFPPLVLWLSFSSHEGSA